MPVLHWAKREEILPTDIRLVWGLQHLLRRGSPVKCVLGLPAVKQLFISQHFFPLHEYHVRSGRTSCGLVLTYLLLILAAKIFVVLCFCFFCACEDHTEATIQLKCSVDHDAAQILKAQSSSNTHQIQCSYCIPLVLCVLSLAPFYFNKLGNKITQNKQYLLQVKKKKLHFYIKTGCNWFSKPCYQQTGGLHL